MKPRAIEPSKQAMTRMKTGTESSESSNNSPTRVEHGDRPKGSRIPWTMQVGLNLKSGGVRFDNGSPKLRPHSVASGSKNLPQFARTLTSFEKRTRSAEKSGESAMWKAKMPGDKSSSNFSHIGLSGSDRTLGAVLDLAASSLNITTAPSKGGLAYDSDVEMDEREVERHK